MCVLMALRLHDENDRDELFLCLLRIKFWVLILFRNGLDKATVLSYNTTPAEEGRGISLLFAARLLPDHMFIILWYEVDHMLRLACSFSALGVFLLCSLSISSLSAEEFLSASTTPNWWPHINHSVLGFDHTFDHKQNRSTRRQDVTRVWKSRFCVAERAKKSKNG